MIDTGLYYFENQLVPMSSDYIRFKANDSTNLVINIKSDDDFALNNIITRSISSRQISKWNMATGRITIVISGFADYVQNYLTVGSVSPNWRTNTAMNYTMYVQSNQHQYSYSCKHYDDYKH